MEVRSGRGRSARPAGTGERMPGKQDPGVTTRRRILDAALGEFAERGLERARMAVVGRRAGVANGTVYWHFETKPRLYRAVVEHAAEGLFADVVRVAEAPGATFMDVVDRQLEYLDGHPEVDALLASVRGGHPLDEVREVARVVDGRVVEIWRRWIAQAARGPVRENVARLVAVAVAGALSARSFDAAVDVRALLGEFGLLVESDIGRRHSAAHRLEVAD